MYHAYTTMDRFTALEQTKAIKSKHNKCCWAQQTLLHATLQVLPHSEYNGMIPELSAVHSDSFMITAATVFSKLTRGQSNLTKSASRGAHSPVRGHPRGSKSVPLNSWGRGSYQCSIVTIGLGCTVWPQCMHVTTNQRCHDTAYLNKCLFY